jgi:ABC-type dipeptide/oligopeptide/nickel transport system permease component
MVKIVSISGGPVRVRQLDVAILTFALIHLAPGDPIYVLAGQGGTPEYYADIRARAILTCT